MSKDQQRVLIENVRQSLLDDIERGASASETVELEQNKVGRLSRMDAMQQQEMQKAAQLLIRHRLLNIDRALAALEKDEYGFCELCGEQIPPLRLQVKPEALTCVDCQQKTESNH